MKMLLETKETKKKKRNEMSKIISVGNLNQKTDKESIETIFKRYGPVISVELSDGFGLVVVCLSLILYIIKKTDQTPHNSSQMIEMLLMLLVT